MFEINTINIQVQVCCEYQASIKTSGFQSNDKQVFMFIYKYILFVVFQKTDLNHIMMFLLEYCLVGPMSV